MLKYVNGCAMEPSNVTLTLFGERHYFIYGFAIRETVNNKVQIRLQPADLRRKPVMIVPLEEVKKVECKF